LRWLSQLLAVLLILGGFPLGAVLAPVAGLQSAPAEEDENIETGKLVVTVSQEQHPHRRAVSTRPFIPVTNQTHRPIPVDRSLLNSTTAFLAAVNSPLTC
jgi:hypothetical protein